MSDRGSELVRRIVDPYFRDGCGRNSAILCCEGGEEFVARVDTRWPTVRHPLHARDVTSDLILGGPRAIAHLSGRLALGDLTIYGTHPEVNAPQVRHAGGSLQRDVDASGHNLP